MPNPRAPSSSRRAILGALVAAPAVALPSLAALPAVASGPHPDAALSAAESAYREAKAAYEAANERANAAREAFRADLGPCPPELEDLRAERVELTHPGAPYEVRRCRAFRWVELPEGTCDVRQAWTSAGLRMAIRYAVPLFGVGGRTPHRIRRWRSLLPTAEMFDARCAALDARHQVEALNAAARAADKEQIAAEVRFSRMPAVTTDGLALKVQHLDNCGWMGMGAPWIALLQSAAAVAGVKLREPEFDCDRWARELREAGGSLKWDDASGGVWVGFPVSHTHSTEHQALLRRLSDEQRDNREEIAFWLSQGGAA